MNKMKIISLLLLLIIGGLNAMSFEGCLKYLESKKAVDPEFINKTMENMKRDYETESFLTKKESELLCRNNYCGKLIEYYQARIVLSTDDPELACKYEQRKEEEQKNIRMTLEYLKEQQKEKPQENNIQN